jgi:hypothetical protein
MSRGSPFVPVNPTQMVQGSDPATGILCDSSMLMYHDITRSNGESFIHERELGKMGFLSCQPHHIYPPPNPLLSHQACSLTPVGPLYKHFDSLRCGDALW